MMNLSSAMGGQFAIAATEITERVKGLGPNPLRQVRVAQGASIGGRNGQEPFDMEETEQGKEHPSPASQGTGEEASNDHS